MDLVGIATELENEVGLDSERRHAYAVGQGPSDADNAHCCAFIREEDASVYVAR